MKFQVLYMVHCLAVSSRLVHKLPPFTDKTVWPKVVRLQDTSASAPMEALVTLHRGLLLAFCLTNGLMQGCVTP